MKSSACHSEPFDFTQGKLREESQLFPCFLGILRLRLRMTHLGSVVFRGAPVKIFLILFCIFLFPFYIHAAEKKGKLDKFEEEIEQPNDNSRESSTSESAVAGGVIDLFSSFFLIGLSQGGTINYAELRQELKVNESPALPTIRVEPSYQYVFDGVHGFAGNLEAGYLMFAADGEFLYYWETANNDNMQIGSGHFLLRTLFVHALQANLALGVKTIHGNTSHTGFEIGFPLYIFFGKHFIWDVKPYIAFIKGRDIYDLSSGLSFKYKMFGIRAAYRGISVSGETLHGPQVGAFFQW